MSIVEFLSQPLWQRLGLTLVHFLWQGLAVAVLAGAFVRVFRLKHGNARYGAYLLAFIAMIACPVVTFTAIDISISPDTKLVTGAESTEVVDSSPYTALPAGDVLPEAEIRRPAIPTLANSIPLGQRISDWLNVSMPWILVIWMVGVVVLSVRLLMGFVGVYRWRHHLEPLPERLAQRIVSLSERLGMRGFSRVFISPTVLQAMAVGYLRPMVLLPAAMVTRMQPEMLEAVIAHELAHIRRFDLWVNLAQRVTETLLFYHPAVWWLSFCLRSERELCCDELAVKATGRRLTYATTLESVGRAKVMAKQPILAAGLGQDTKPTLSRVRHILGLDNQRKDSRYWLAGVIAVLLIMAIIIPTGSALIARLEEKSAVQGKSQHIDVETLLNKVRQAQRPTENMIVEWQSESPNPVIVVAGSRKPDFSPPSRILKTYKAIIAGDKSRIEERELTFQSQKDTEPSRIREITHVFDGTMQKQLDHFVKGFENEYRGYRHTYDKNTQLLLKLLLAYPPFLDGPKLQEKYNLKVIENKEKGLIILETSKENSGIHRFTIDPDKDYNIVKQDVILPRGTDYEINCIVKKQANGSWYQVAREQIRYSVKTGKPFLENKVKITKLDFNPEIPTGAFELQFPKGIKIWDGSLKDWIIVGDEEETSREPAVPVKIEEKKDQKELSKFTRTLAIGVPVKGVTVELMGICEHPSEGKQWWRPDGSLLKNSPYDDDFGRAFPKDGEKGYKFAVKYNGIAGRDIDTRVIPLNFKTTNGGALFSTSKKNGKENMKYLDGSLDEKIVWLGAAFDEALVNCDIRIGVCFGDWKRNYRYETDQSNDAVEWVTFKNVSLRPGHNTDVPVEGKFPGDWFLMHEDFYSFGEGETYSKRLSQIFRKVQTYIEQMSAGYGNKSWDDVSEGAIQIRNIFLGLKESVEVDEAVAWEAFAKMWDGKEINVNEAKLIDLARIKRTLEILTYFGGEYDKEETYQNLCTYIVSISDVANEIEKTLRTKGPTMISPHIEKLQAAWSMLTEIDGIKELLRSGYQTKEKTGVPVEGGKSLEDRGEEFRKQAREDLYQEMKQKNAREFAEAYVTALKNKDWNLAASMCRPGSKQARNAHLLGKMCDFNDIDIETVYANKKIALAVTEGLRLIDGRKSQLGITLIKESLGWIVKDLDWLPKGEEEKFLKKFVETFPDAKVISKRKTDVQDESEQSDESAGNVVLPSKGGSEAKSSEGLTLNQGREGSISGKVVGRRIFYQKPESLGRNVLPENFERREDSPLPGVKILLRKDEKALDETITVETGHYAFEDLGPGHYTVWALKPGGTAIEMVWTVPMAGPGPWEDHGTSNLRKVEIKSEAQTDVDLHFRLDGVSISGRVTDDNGNPVSGAGVVIELCTPTKDGGEGRSGAYSKIKLWYGMIRTKTDKDGRFKLDGFCPVTFSEIAGYLMGGEPYRRYEVRVQAEGYSPARILVPPVTEHLASETSRLVEDHKRLFLKQDSLVDEVDLPKSQGRDITGIDLVLQKQAVVAGRVLDTQGNVLPGSRPKASVRLVCVDSSDDKGESLLVQMPDRSGLNWIALDETGRFRIDAVPPGSYLFEVDTIEHRSQRATNEPFTVSAGQVINDIKVIVPSEKTDAPVEVEGATLEEIRKKAWKVFGLAPGVMDYLDSCVKVREEMNPEKLITVRCVDNEGKGISYCRVVFVDRGEQVRLIDNVATDEKGYAYCDDIDGPFSIMAQVFDYSPLTKAWRFQHKKTEKLYNANDKPVITVQWSPFPEENGQIQGNVKDQYDHPLKEFDLVLTQREGQNEGWGDCFTKQIKKHFIHPEGNFEIGNLAAGTYTYFVYPKEQSAYVWDFNMGEVTVGAEDTVQLNIEIEAKNTDVQVEGGKEALTAEKLVLKLVDNSGRPVAGAKVGTSVRTRDKQVLNSKLYWSLSGKEKDFSDEDGKIVLTQDKLFPQSWNPDRKRALYILNEERQIGAFCEISKDNERNQIELTLEPVCHVHGNLSSEDLEKIGRPLTWSNVYLSFNKDSHGVLSCMSEKQQFDFWVPPGEYTLRAYGSGDGARTKTIQPIIEVKTGQSELDLGVVDLPATKLSKMMGKSAPEIGPIKAWKNGSPVKLSELRGKPVILHFGGGYPSTGRDLPILVKLHEDFHDAGLVIIAIYNCESMEQLEQRFRTNSEKYGGAADVPFRLAVDGGQGRPIEGTDRTIPGATYATYEISFYNTTVLINSKGEIVEKLNIHDAKEKLENMLGVEVKTTVSAWRQRFEEVYRLEDNRILKRIAPPFIPERRDYYVNEDSSQASVISRSPDRFIFHWPGKLRNWGCGFTHKLDLDSILLRVLRLKSFEYDGPEELLSIELPGDWIIRDEVSQKIKLQALEQLIAEEFSRTIQFEKPTVERQVIVATGSFKFHPPSETYEHKSVHLYTDELDPDEGSGGGTADSVNDFILILGSLVDMPVVDHTESSKKNIVPYRHHRSAYLSKLTNIEEKAKKLEMLLANLTKQTELQFRIEKRPVEVWFITEKKKDK